MEKVQENDKGGGEVTRWAAGLLLCLACYGQDCITKPCSTSGNFSADILGAADTRPSTWGDAGVQTWPVTFKPPAGYRVQILSLKGDLVAWAKVLPGDAPVPDGMSAGILLGYQTTAAAGSIRCSPCADNTMLYIQSGVSRAPVRAPYEYDVRAGGLLELDNVLMVVVAAWLNVTGKPIHMEPTFTVTFRYEAAQ